MSYYDNAVMLRLSLGRWNTTTRPDRRGRVDPLRHTPPSQRYFWLE